ncbi:MAG: sulfur carrier protein ThiS [Butyricicoccaceae bacterium]
MKVNGTAMPLIAPMTVAALLEQLGYNPQRVAVELDGNIVRRAEFGSVALSDDSTVEIVGFVGGG